MSLKFQDAFELYFSELESRGQSKSTLTHNRRWLGFFSDFSEAKGVQEVQAINEEHVSSFCLRVTWEPGMQGKLLSPGSVHQCLSMVRSFLRWLHDRGDLFRDVTRGWILPRPPVSYTRVPTTEEMSTLLLTFDETSRLGRRNRAILELLYGTGLRVGECCSLELEHLDLDSSLLRVVDGKGKKGRLLPLGTRLKQVLKRYLKDREEFTPPEERGLFVSLKGSRLSDDAIAMMVYNASKKAGMKPFRPHAIRRGFATHLLENGANIPVIQALLGHENLSSTQIYVALDLKALKVVYDRTHPRAKRQPHNLKKGP